MSRGDATPIRGRGYDPDWTIAPGATLRDWREENRLGVKAAATTCAMDVNTYERIESGKKPIGQVTACKLQQGTGIPATLWLNLERHYRADIKAGRKDTTDA
jgi:plasmid maintenance system antidote protein VapI